MIISGLGQARWDVTGGGFVPSNTGEGYKAPGQAEFENIVRALPKCATESELVTAMRQAIQAFPDAPSGTLGTLRAAVADPRRRLQTNALGVYCNDSPQRQQVYRAISAAFQGHAVEIGIADTERKAMRELVTNLDPTGPKFWDDVWDKAKPFVYVGGAALALITISNVAKAVKALKS